MPQVDKTKTGPLKRICLLLLPFLLYTSGLIWLAWPLSFFSNDWTVINFNSFSLSDLFTTNTFGLSGVSGFYRPLPRLTLYLNYLISGVQPAFFHITNVIFHALCSLLVFFLCREFVSKKSYLIPVLASYLFFVLPAHTDTIFRVAGRAETVCAIFFFLTIIYYLRYISSPSPGLFLISGLCFWGALLSKEMSLSLPGVLIVLALYKQKLFKKHTGYLLLFILISYSTYFLIRLHVLGSFFVSPGDTYFSPTRILNSLVMASRTIFKTNRHYIGIGVPLLTASVVLSSLKERNLLRDLLFLSCLFLVTLLPVLGLVMLWYLYIPSAFACLILTKVWLECFQNKPLKRIILVVFVGFLFYYGITLYQEGFIWRDASKISERTLESVMSHIGQERGRVFLVNVPSAYSPVQAVGEKPIFAYNLDAALKIKSGEALEAVPVVINHLWLLDEKPGISSIERLSHSGFMVKCKQDGFFSFHTPEFISGKLRPANITLDLSWGQLHIVNERKINFRIDPYYKGEKILFYDGSSWSRL